MAKNPSPLKVGDLCITVNCNAAINHGLLVVVTGIIGRLIDHRGVLCPITIRRVDGQPFPSSICPTTGRVGWYSRTVVYTVPSKLRRIDPEADDQRDAKLTKRPRRDKGPVLVGAYANPGALDKEE